MLRHLASGSLWAGVGYLLGALAVWCLVFQFSSNYHDKSVEAVMTALFAGGPAGAVVGCIVGVVRSVRRR